MAKQNATITSHNRTKAANEKRMPASATFTPSTPNRRDTIARPYCSKPNFPDSTVLSTKSGTGASVTSTSSQGLVHGKCWGAKLDLSECGLEKVSKLDRTLSKQSVQYMVMKDEVVSIKNNLMESNEEEGSVASE